MKLLFINLSGPRFDVSTPDNAPLGGSESCLCYLARQLAKNGHDICLICRPPENGLSEVMGVRHLPPAALKDTDFFAASNFDAILVVNAPLVFPALKALSPRSRHILWCHMLPDQTAMACLPEVLPLIDHIVYVADGQKKSHIASHGIAHAASVIGNGMAPAFENMFLTSGDLRGAKLNRAAYTSTPFRGLKPLLNVMEKIESELTLDIYSSMRVYQMADDSYADLYARAKNNPRIQYHGSIAQSRLAKELRQTAFLTYPCIFAECYCLAALESQAAGMKVIATDCGSLRESTMGFADLMPLPTDNSEEFVALFASLVNKNVQEFQTHPELWSEKMFDQVQHVNRECRWSHRAHSWENLLRSQIEVH